MYDSPLRYPGGKRKLANFFKLLFRANDLVGGTYVEPYAGGAAVALALLFGDYVERIHINDLDRGIYAFWHAVLHDTDALCARITEVDLTMDEWERQRMVHEAEAPDPLDLALATFFLNRTNRSGIITGGVIGGKGQDGKWKLDARFNKEELIDRIERIGVYRDHITITNEDAITLLEQLAPPPEATLIYLDPPYYVKGKSMLYANYYNEDDHAAIAQQVKSLQQHWIVSYDNDEAIRSLYKPYRTVVYGIQYSTQERYEGKEIIFFSDGLQIPDIKNPSSIRAKRYRQLKNGTIVCKTEHDSVKT